MARSSGSGPAADAGGPKSPKDWEGRERTLEERLDDQTHRRLAATLDLPPPSGDRIPEGWHWLYFLSQTPAAELGPDGHEKLGGFMPDVSPARRMFAGGRSRHHRPLRAGEPCRLRERIARVSEKAGRTGPLVFVDVERSFEQEGVTAVEEVQTIVYRRPGAPAPEPPRAPEVVPASEGGWGTLRSFDPVLLFRFSALTFNGHRIHYDRAYACEHEGYPGLVVHGPLIAILLMEEARARAPEGSRLEAFSFKAASPLFDDEQVALNGRMTEDEATLWAAGPDDRLVTSAEARFAR